MLKDYLTSKQISFVEKLVDVDEEAQKQMSLVSGGFMGVPFTLVEKEDGTNQTILGFDRGKIDTIIG